MKIVIINGPNLNLLGKREPSIYGNQSFEDYFKELKEKFTDHELHYFQSNHEGDLIDKIQEEGFVADGIVINPAAYTHTSIAIADTIRAIDAPAVEVHISNIQKREKYRQHSFTQDACIHSIVGKGLKGYDIAIRFLISNSSAALKNEDRQF